MRDRRQTVFLKEMGYTLWRLRQGGGEAEKSKDSAYAKNEEETAPRQRVYSVSGAQKAAREQAWESTQKPMRNMPERSAAISPPPPEALAIHAPEARQESNISPDDRAKAIAPMDWEDLTEAIRECRACELCRYRKQAVPGVGDQAAQWLFIGEGPGAEEDARGEPFVGQAGRLLDAMLSAIGLKRGENVYIANAVKCRPEGNRTPLPPEMAVCRPFLLRQIALLRPAVIVLLGKAATHSVLGDDASLASLRKKTHCFDDIPVVVTYHPAYLLRNLPEKAKAWEDLCLARQLWRGTQTKN
ncbi:MAG: uracil-DNA glycosylase [Betaproteobacteria bacterium]|nr:uracil-DNA glycosylase [Betaproteobacteria bacterium]